MDLQKRLLILLILPKVQVLSQKNCPKGALSCINFFPKVLELIFLADFY
jgi:hypothetical protein